MVARGRDSSRELYIEKMEALVGLVGLGAPVGGGCAGVFVDVERVPLPPRHCRLGNADVVVARCRAPNSCVRPTIATGFVVETNKVNAQKNKRVR